jgi:hypothetical protein
MDSAFRVPRSAFRVHSGPLVMSLPEEMAADLAELETEIPITFAWNGSDYPTVTGPTRRSRDLQPGGFGLEAALVLFVRADLFADVDARPQSKQRLTFEDQSWRIDEVTQVAGSPFLRLTCNDPAQNA